MIRIHVPATNELGDKCEVKVTMTEEYLQLSFEGLESPAEYVTIQDSDALYMYQLIERHRRRTLHGVRSISGSVSKDKRVNHD